MNSRERVKLALNHKEPDRLPFDLGGTVLTSIHINSYDRLREFLGLPTVDVQVMDIFQQIASVDDDVRQKLGADIRNVAPRSSATFQIEINTTDLPGYDFFYDEWGIGWRKPQDGGFFYDMFDHPLAKATSIDDIKNFPWPDPTDPTRFEGLRKRAKHVAEELGECVILGGLSAGFLEVTAWQRGFASFYPDLATNLEWLEYLMDTIVDLKLAYWDIALPKVGEYADVVQEADDVAGQHGLLMSPDVYRSVIKPRHKKIFDFIKERTDAKIFYHCCGAIGEIIPDLIEIGVDIINPVQVNATGMESKALKRDFGDDITFWGGLVDTQGVFTDGTPEQVRNEVRRRIDDFGPSGGFVAAAVHNIQANVPAENIMTMWETLQEYGVFNEDNAPGRRPDKYWKDYPDAPEPPIAVSASPDALPACAPSMKEILAMAKENGTNIPDSAAPVIEDLADAVLNGNAAVVRGDTQKALDAGVAPQALIECSIIPAMTEVGRRFEVGDYFLPEMMASSVAAQASLSELKPLLTGGSSEHAARVVIGTVKGDLHDIGKNLVGMMLEGSGFEVIDLGPDVPPEVFVEAIIEHKPQIIGMSALLTTTMPMMPATITAINEAGLRDQVKIMVGGAGVTQLFCDDIGADGFAPDASSAVRKAKGLVGD